MCLCIVLYDTVYLCCILLCCLNSALNDTNILSGMIVLVNDDNDLMIYTENYNWTVFGVSVNAFPNPSISSASIAEVFVAIQLQNDPVCRFNVSRV